MLTSRRETRATSPVSLLQLQAQPGVEEDDPDGDRHHGGDQLLAEQGVGVEGADRPGAEPQREQQQDRREPEHLGDQRRRRCQNRHQPELEQGARLGERRQRECREQNGHRLQLAPGVAGAAPVAGVASALAGLCARLASAASSPEPETAR